MFVKGTLASLQVDLLNSAFIRIVAGFGCIYICFLLFLGVPVLNTDVPMTGTPPKPIECKPEYLDACAIFGGFQTGFFRLSSDPTIFIQCTGTEIFYCTQVCLFLSLELDVSE